MLGDEMKLSNAVDRALAGLGQMENARETLVDERQIREGQRRAAILRNAALRAAIRKLVAKRRNRSSIPRAVSAPAE